MDIQLFATDEELQDFPENKTDSSTAQDKTPNIKSINLAASDLPRSHSDLPKFSSKLPERKSKRRSRKGNRHQSCRKNPIVGRQANTAKNPVDHQAVTSKYPIVGRQWAQAKNPIVDRLAAQTNDQLDTKQEIQWVGKPIHETYLDQLVSPSEAALPSQPTLGSPEIAPPVVHQPEAHQPVLHPPVVRPPMVHPPVTRQLTPCQPMVRQPVVHQPSHHVPLLLSLCLQPNLDSLARTLSPQKLRYIQLGIQIGQNLLN